MKEKTEIIKCEALVVQLLLYPDGQRFASFATGTRTLEAEDDRGLIQVPIKNEHDIKLGEVYTIEISLTPVDLNGSCTIGCKDCGAKINFIA